MLTGDSGRPREAVARKLGIDQVVAEVLPDQKAEDGQQLQDEGDIVAMAVTASTMRPHWRRLTSDRDGNRNRRGDGERRMSRSSKGTCGASSVRAV